MKSYTDLVQSKKLAEILPPESADCYWDYDEMQKFHRISCFEDGYNKESQLRLNENNVCAWSLAALLDILQYPTLFQRADQKWGCDVWIDTTNPYSVSCKDEPIDACYEMILKLHELNLL